jgi:FkbM family methyltransferase
MNALVELSASKGIQLVEKDEFIDFASKDRLIRISKRHSIYSKDIIYWFDYYFSAVAPISCFGLNMVDYSTPRYHDVIGYDRHPIYFSSFSEPLATTNQYLGFADLKPGEVAIDLGSYSGLTSIIFKDLVGTAGTVIAIDADIDNIITTRKNLDNYSRSTGNNVDILHGAVWIHNRGLEFSSEGNMGASACDIVGFRGKVSKVPSYRLIDVATKYNLKKVDFIKCDIEGGESVIFEDAEFFKEFRPRVIIESHAIKKVETTEKCISDMRKHGYECKTVPLIGGSRFPLIECYPPIQ